MTRVVVCGSNYGAYYVSALRRRPGFELAGILARGSDRSIRLARRHGVPLFLDVGELPEAIDVACFAVGTAGESLVIQLLERGVHVLSEHPIGSQHVASAARAAERFGQRFHVNAHFTDLPEVQKFISRCREHWVGESPSCVEVIASDRALYAVMAILAEASLQRPSHLKFERGRPGRPYTRVDGNMAGTQLLLSVQRTDGEGEHDLADGSPGILIDFGFRVIFPTGVLSLLSPAGPVVWIANGNRVEDGGSGLWSIEGAASRVSAREFYDQRIDANLRAVEALVADAASGTVPDNQTAEHLLRVSRMWEAASEAVSEASRVGPKG